jgi:hypothetical protein
MESDAAPSRSLSPKPLGSLGRDEMNLAEFPITLLTDRVPKDQTEAVYQDEIFDERTGRTLTRKLTITAGNHGLTTAVDDEIILALIQLTKIKNNFTNRRVQFTRHELIQLLGWSVGGAKYERIEVALDRWTSVHLKYENAWRDNRTKTWTSKEAFHIIDKYELNDTRTAGDQLDLIPSYIVWGEDIFESFQAGYLKPLDYDLCMSLSNSTAKRMYRFLDKRFHFKPDWTFDLKEFAHEHVGLAHLKRNLQPAVAELEAIGFLEPLPTHERFQKDGKDWKIRLIQKGVQSPALAASQNSALPLAEPDSPPLLTELVNRGVTRATAAELVHQHPAETIQAKIDVFDWLMMQKDKRVAKSPAGYLVKSITDDYTAPKGFITPAERQAHEDKARQDKARQAEEKRRQKQTEAREQEAIDHIKGLTPAERAALEAKALAAASPESRQTYDNPDMAKFRPTLLHMMLRQYVMEHVLHRESETADA